MEANLSSSQGEKKTHGIHVTEILCIFTIIQLLKIPIKYSNTYLFIWS